MVHAGASFLSETGQQDGEKVTQILDFMMIPAVVIAVILYTLHP